MLQVPGQTQGPGTELRCDPDYELIFALGWIYKSPQIDPNLPPWVGCSVLF